MKNLSLCLILLLLIVVANDAQSRKTLPRVQLLEVGEFHGDEVNARTSGGWLGLFVSKKESALRLANIRVSRVFDPIVDDGTKQMTGKRVSVSQPISPIFLVKNVTMLMPGSVKTILSEPISLTSGTTLDLVLEAQRYQLQIKPAAISREQSNVLLVRGEMAQTLFPNMSNEEGGFTVYWAGDLDGDGKLDLYVNASPHDNVESKRLWLSSQAGKGKLVQEIARFEITGC